MLERMCPFWFCEQCSWVICASIQLLGYVYVVLQYAIRRILKAMLPAKVYDTKPVSIALGGMLHG